MAYAYPFLYMLLSVLGVWATMVMPFSILLAWISNQSPVPYLIPSLLLSPVCVIVGKWLVRLTREYGVFWLMQLFGVGCIVASCTAIAGVLTFFIPYRMVGVIVVIVAVPAIWRAVSNANRIINVNLDIHSALLSKPVKLVHLSDVHIGSRNRHFLRKVVDQVNEHEPDVVVITGDLVDCDHIGGSDLQALRLLRCPVFMSTGNHEFDIDVERCLQAIRDQGVTVIRDDKLQFGEIEMLGIDDRKRGYQIEPVLKQLDASDSKFSLLMYHRPDGWDTALKYNVDLMLAGHTHSGQIWPFSHVVKVYYRQLVGYFTESDKHLYVSSGTGTWGPSMRLGSVNEMTIISLHPETAGADSVSQG